MRRSIKICIWIKGNLKSIWCVEISLVWLCDIQWTNSNSNQTTNTKTLPIFSPTSFFTSWPSYWTTSLQPTISSIYLLLLNNLLPFSFLNSITLNYLQINLQKKKKKSTSQIYSQPTISNIKSWTSICWEEYTSNRFILFFFLSILFTDVSSLVIVFLWSCS